MPALMQNEAMSAPIDGRHLRNVFGRLPSGVVAICGLWDGQPVGMAASTFTPVSIDPALALVCIQNGSSTWCRLSNLPGIGISVLGEQHEILSRRLGARNNPGLFSEIDWRLAVSGAIHIAGAAATFECMIESVTPAGDHEIVLLRINKVDCQSNIEPIVFHGSQFRRLVR